MNKKTIRVTEYVKLLEPENENSLFFIRRALKKQNRDLEWYSKRGTKIHKKLEKEITAKKKSELTKAVVNLIEGNAMTFFDENIITEKTLKNENILANYNLQGTFDLIYKGSLYDYKTISQSRISNKDNVKRIAIQQLLYMYLIDKETDIVLKNGYIVWINLDKDSQYTKLVLFEIRDEEQTRLIDLQNQFDNFEELYAKRIKDKKFKMINKGEFIF